MPDLLAERVGLSLRDRACGFAAAPVEQGPHPQPHSARTKKGVGSNYGVIGSDPFFLSGVIGSDPFFLSYFGGGASLLRRMLSGHSEL